jgi:Dolichyl-phosphate-mannose-protein mannosyltransferase
MKRSTEFSRNLPFYSFVLGVFLIIVCKDVLSNGMFLDGVIYSTVSKNLTDGLGTFWNPHFTFTLLPDFHEHPPLAFGIQSMFYTLLGESRYVDKIYSLFTVALAGFIIVRIWKSLGFRHGWVPLFIWIITPTVFWASYNNVLENTMTIFTSLSVLFYLKNQDSKKYIFIFLSGFMLALGFLTKGFVAFFPWTFPFLLWILLKQKSFGKMAIDSAGIIFFTLAPLILISLVSPSACLYFHRYIDGQVIDSITRVVTVKTRFDIVERLFFELAPVAILSVLLLLWAYIKKIPSIPSKGNINNALVFIILGLTGVLPIMISMKQSGFYIVPAYPFFAIGVGVLVYPTIDFLFHKINYESAWYLLFKWTGYILFISGIILSVCFSDRFSRDSDKIKDIYVVLPEIPHGSIININPEMYSDWSLHAYFGRFKNISLDPDLNSKRDFLLIKNEFYSDTLRINYELIKIGTEDYKLLRRK